MTLFRLLSRLQDKRPDQVNRDEWRRLSLTLGPLAGEWLSDEADQIRRSSGGWFEDPSRIFEDAGVVLLVPKLGTTGLLREAVPLPLRWHRGAAHDPRLPVVLIELATGIVERAADLLERDADLWGLRLPDDLDLDLSDFPFSAESAGAVLMGGLIVAASRARLSPSVWGTGRWSESDDIVPVSNIVEKVELAVRNPRILKLFVPHENLDEARRAAEHYQSVASSVEICEFGERGASVYARFGNWLAAHDVPPEPDAPIEVRSKYCVRWRRWNESKADDYYNSHLLDDIIARCRDKIPGEFADVQPRLLVSVVSNSPELIDIGVGIWRPDCCILLYTTSPDMSGALEKARASIRKRRPGIHVEALEIRDGDDVAQLARQVRAKVADPASGSGDVVYDVTPGTKLMSLALFRAARDDDLICYLSSRMVERRAVPGTEQPQVWKKRDA